MEGQTALDVFAAVVKVYFSFLERRHRTARSNEKIKLLHGFFSFCCTTTTATFVHSN